MRSCLAYVRIRQSFEVTKMNVVNTKKYRVWLVLACWSLLLFGNANPAFAEMKVMTSEEFERFQQECEKDENCSKVFNEIRTKAIEYKKELDSVCENNLDECVKRQTEGFMGYIDMQLSCSVDLEAEECEKALNTKAESAEKELLFGRWCDENGEACKVLRKTHKKRVSSKLSWCSENSKNCRQVIDRHTEQVKLVKENRRKAEERARNEYRLYREKRENEWFMSRATCDGKVEECIDQINEKMDFFEKRRLERSCKQNKETLCSRIKRERAARIERKMTWCEVNKEVCEEAKNKLMAANSRKE